MANRSFFYLKDPDSIEPYGFDWEEWLLDIGNAEIVMASEWAVTGSDSALTLTSPSIVTDGKRTQVILNGGTVGERYTVSNKITSSSDFKDERSFEILVREK